MLHCYIKSAFIVYFAAILTLSFARHLSRSSRSRHSPACSVPAVINGRAISIDADGDSSRVLPGTPLFIACDEGYRLSDGSIDIPLVCLSDGKWSKRPEMCVEIATDGGETQEEAPSECPVPYVRNGDIFGVLGENRLSSRPLVWGDTVPVGIRIRVVCFQGFRLPRGAASDAVCVRHNVRWSNSIGPCRRTINYERIDYNVQTPPPTNIKTREPQIKDCGAPPEIENGQVAAGSSAVGRRRKILCSQGYTIKDPNYVECLPDGAWSRPGHCAAVIMLDTYKPSFGPKRQPQGYRRQTQSMKEVIRNPPSRLPPPEFQSPIREFYSHIRGHPPPEQNSSYHPVTCPAKPFIPNGHVTKGGISVGQVRRVFCSPGFVLQGANTIVCSKFGHWSVPGFCVDATIPNSYRPRLMPTGPMDCGPPPLVRHGNFSKNMPYYTTGSQRMKLKCQPGYYIVGPETIFCNEDEWSEAGVCIRKGGLYKGIAPGDNREANGTFTSCTYAQFVHHGRLTKTTVGDETKRKLVCDIGFTIMVSTDVICDRRSRRWKPLGYCLENVHFEKINNLPNMLRKINDNDRTYFGYSWDRAPLLGDDSGCYNPKAQSGTDGSFWSLHYPCAYENRLHCVWDVVAPEGDYIAMAFNDIFYVEPGPDSPKPCPYDSLSFYLAKDGVPNNGSNFELVASVCGDQRPKNMVLQGSTARVVFITDNRYNGYGFRLTWASIRPSRLHYIMNNS